MDGSDIGDGWNLVQEEEGTPGLGFTLLHWAERASQL